MGVVVVAVGWVVTNQDVSHKLWWLMNKWLVVVSDERERECRKEYNERETALKGMNEWTR